MIGFFKLFWPFCPVQQKLPLMSDIMFFPSWWGVGRRPSWWVWCPLWWGIPILPQILIFGHYYTLKKRENSPRAISNQKND